MNERPRLLMLPPAPVLNTNPAHPILDDKFVTGMLFACTHWPGRIDCLLRNQTSEIPFGSPYALSDLPFGVEVAERDTQVDPALFENYDVIELSGDTHLDLDLPGLAKRQKLSARIVFVIEYTLQTRLQVIRLDRGLSMPGKLKSAIWTLGQERRRRRAMRASDALQTNGYPAFDTYRRLNPDTLLYLDNRMRNDLFATDEEVATRAFRLSRGAPLRFINSGRLEPMKGAQDLVPFASALRDRGVSFTLDIYGTGSLESEIHDTITAAKLDGIVTLHAPVDFETGLVPISRSAADIFLSLNRQSDPSCTYIEAMGCGLPILGYANDMLRRLVQVSNAGWTVPMGNVAALAASAAQRARDLETIPVVAGKALSFARAHGFEAEFSMRHAHLAKGLAVMGS